MIHRANIERWLDRSQKNGLTLQINSNVQRQIVNMIISDKYVDEMKIWELQTYNIM